MGEKKGLKYYLFEKRYGKLSFWKVFKKISIAFLILYTPIAAVAFISNASTNSDKYAAILLSADAITGHDHYAPPVAFLGSYPSWTFYFNSKGLKTDFIFSATKKDFLDVLYDDKYQSIVLVGHGSFNGWKATDELIDNVVINRHIGKFKKKKGEWFQLTCPSPDYSDVHLGELVMENKKPFYYNDEYAGNIDFIWDAIFAFQHLKAEAAERERIKKRVNSE